MLARLKKDIRGQMRAVPNIIFNIWKKDYGRGIEITDTNIINYVRESFIAGRAECPNGCTTFEGDMYFIDCNSMYPYVLASFSYPSHIYRPAADKDLGQNGGKKMGFYTCNVDQSGLGDQMNIIPVPKKTYDWEDKSLQTGVILNHVDIGMIRRYGGTVDVKSGYVFDALKDSPYREIIKILYTERLTAESKDDKDLLKFAMNSLSGKIIQFGYFHHASYFYSLARMWMYDIMYSQGRKNVLYTDTDSVLIRKDTYDQLSNSTVKDFGPIFGDIIGQFKLDVRCDRAELHNSKRYLLTLNGQIVKDHRSQSLSKK